MNWTKASKLVRSPIVRLAAAVPTVGYFILYGDAFAGMLDFTDSLGASHFILPADVKLRMLYYGGFLIGAALIAYLWKCPDYCKRIPNIKLAEDEFLRTGGVDDLYVHAGLFEGLKSYAVISYSERLQLECTRLLREIFRERGYGALQEYMEGDHADFFESWDAPALNEPALRDYLYANEHLVLIGDRYQLDPLFTQFVNAVVGDNYYRYSGNAAVKSAAKDLYIAFYEIAEATYPTTQRIVYVSSRVGVALAALPAIDVFLQVVIGDVGAVCSFLMSLF
jgi:hypothetical protein